MGGREGGWRNKTEIYQYFYLKTFHLVNSIPSKAFFFPFTEASINSVILILSLALCASRILNHEFDNVFPKQVKRNSQYFVLGPEIRGGASHVRLEGFWRLRPIATTPFDCYIDFNK